MIACGSSSCIPASRQALARVPWFPGEGMLTALSDECGVLCIIQTKPRCINAGRHKGKTAPVRGGSTHDAWQTRQVGHVTALSGTDAAVHAFQCDARKQVPVLGVMDHEQDGPGCFKDVTAGDTRPRLVAGTPWRTPDHRAWPLAKAVRKSTQTLGDRPGLMRRIAT